MNRREFTKKISRLILQMVNDGEHPIFDYCLRSSEEQNRLFEKKLSKCDGYKKKSNHQLGRAMDIYLTDKNGNALWEWNDKKALYWHSVWAKNYGGSPIIRWDAGHFQG